MLERLKQPFWFGLPLYAWLAGGAALILGAGYFAFFAKASAAATAPQTDTQPTDPLNPYPSTDPGAGATVPPAAAFAPAGTVVYSTPSAAYLSSSAPITTPSTQGMAGVLPPSRTTASVAPTQPFRIGPFSFPAIQIPALTSPAVYSPQAAALAANRVASGHGAIA